MKLLKTLATGIIALAITTSCNKNNNCITGSGSNISKNYNVSSYTIIDVYGEADIYVTKDSVRSLRIEGQNNVLNAINVTENGTLLSIGKDNCFNSMNRLKIYASTPSFTEINTSGSCNVFANDNFSENSFRASLSGSGNMELNIAVQEFNSRISGDGKFKATGNAIDQFYQISGSGFYQCFGLVGENVDIDISGVGDLEVNVSKTLNVEISGSGKVYYKGHPTITTDISGTGSVIDAN